MTRQKSSKREVRTRMPKTGERYAAARSRVIELANRPEPEVEMPVSDQAMRDATGRDWAGWLTMLDEWGALDHTHTETARYLVDEHGISGWWSQAVTVGYERARGMRRLHEVSSGFAVGANRTIAVALQRASDAFTDAALRRKWLPDVDLRQRTTKPGWSARFDWPKDGSRVVVYFVPKADDRTQVSVQHERLPDSDAAERMKSFWRERLTELKKQLETSASE